MAMFNADFGPSGCSSTVPSPTSSPSSARALSEGNATKKGRANSISHYENVASSITGIRPPNFTRSRPSIFIHFNHHQSIIGQQQHLDSSLPSSPPPLSPGAISVKSTRRALSLTNPNSCFNRAKKYYQKSPLRHIGPWILLLFYALLGALLFFFLESENERLLLRKEWNSLERLRQQTLKRLNRVERHHQKEVLIQFENELIKIKIPDTLAWDFWGALYYVQTVFTTIGYGNITPRTTAGQAFSIVYAIVGIPLVLALLNQTSRRMTRWLSLKWINYRQKVRSQQKKQKIVNENSIQKDGRDAEEGKKNYFKENSNNEFTNESRTIPIWMALALVGGYVCAIAAIFLAWENRWSYFTSFYFICISCLTIGLGDVVPDHPHMLILMFVFVIFGLSFVSMLISVIQIKMEEWLYRMLIRMQKEYQKALQSTTDPEERDKILNDLLAKEPWYMRELAPLCVSEKQTVKLENLAEKYERILLPTNTRGIQTEFRPITITEEKNEDDTEGDNMKRKLIENEEKVKKENISKLKRSNSSQSDNSVSDATSLPMDPSSITFSSPIPPLQYCKLTQTDEIIERLNKEVKELKEIGINTSINVKTISKGTQHKLKTENQRLDTNGLIIYEDKSIGFEIITKSRMVQTGRKQRKNRKNNNSDEDENSLDDSDFWWLINRSCQNSPLILNNFECQTDPMTICDAIETIFGPSLQLERSESIQVLVGDDDEEMGKMIGEISTNSDKKAEKHDLVIQTDDSYLRIARRLDTLRTGKSESNVFANVYCTGADIPKKVNTGRRKSLRFLEPASDFMKEKFGWHNKTEHGEEEKREENEEEKKEDEEKDENKEILFDENRLFTSNNRSKVTRKRIKKHVQLPPEDIDKDDDEE